MGILETPDSALIRKYSFYSTLNPSNRRAGNVLVHSQFLQNHGPSLPFSQAGVIIGGFFTRIHEPCLRSSQSVAGEVMLTRGSSVARLIPVICISRRKIENFFKEHEWIVCVFPKQSGCTIECLFLNAQVLLVQQPFRWLLLHLQQLGACPVLTIAVFREL